MATISEDETSRVRFGTFEVDLRAGELRRNGSKVKVQEQPFQILAMLLARPGQVVTREELQKKLWPSDIFVDFDRSLNAAIRRLRDALGDSAENPRFVETVARRGYRFLAPVNGAALNVVSQPAFQNPARPKQFRIFLAVAALLLCAAVGVVLAYWRHESNQTRSIAINPRRLTASSEENPVLGAAISPDGKYLAFADKTGFYLRQIDTGETHALSLPSGFRPVPAAWYPDGTHLIATWVEGPTSPSSLWQISILGGTPRKLIADGRLPAISGNGEQIALVKGPKHADELWIMQADGEDPRQLVACSMCSFGIPAWSPDGRAIAYVVSRYGKDWRVNSAVDLFELGSHRQDTIFSADNRQDRIASEIKLGPALVWTSDNLLVYSISEPPPNQDDSNVWSVLLDSHRHIAGTAIRLTAAPDEVVALSASKDAKRITYTKSYLSPGIYVSDLNPTADRVTRTERLTLDNWRDYPFAWTGDSKALLFSSDRDGTFHIFKQQLGDGVAELLVGGSEELSLPRLAPDNTTILFEIWPPLGTPELPRRIMRLPAPGGPPQAVVQHAGLGNMQCARPPSNLCLYDLRSPTRLSFFRFDPISGKNEELPQIALQDENSYAYNWTLSPDGKILAVAKGKVVENSSVTFVALDDGSKHTVSTEAWAGINSIDFAADNRSVWASAYTNTGKWALLNIDLQGHTKTILEDAQMIIGWAIPSPDGKHLAFWKARGTSNVWMLEGFSHRGSSVALN